MASRYKVIFHRGKTQPDLNQIVPYLSEVTGSPPDEIAFWIENPPHVLTSNASESKARELRETLSGFGLEIRVEPDLADDFSDNALKNPVNWDLQAAKKIRWTAAGAGASMALIAGITLVFILSVGFSYFYIQKNFFPDAGDGETLLEQGAYGAAQKAFTEKIHQEEGRSSHYLNRGKARVLRIRASGQKSNWSRHLTSRSWDSGVHNIRNYYRSPIGDSALMDLRMAHRLDDKNPEVLKWLGILHGERGTYDSAAAAFARSLRLNPRDTEIINFLATAYIGMEQYHKAVEVLEKALRLNPSDPLSLKNLGSLNLFHLGDSARSLRYYLRYLKLKKAFDFERPVIRQEVTNILWNQHFPNPVLAKKTMPYGKFETRRTELEQNTHGRPLPEVYLDMGNLFWNRNMVQEALIYWLKSLQKNPKQPDLYDKLFKIQARLGRFSESRGTLESAMRQDSALPSMHFALGLLYKYYEEDPARAINSFTDYLKTGDPAYRGAAKLELGELLGK